jgi:ribosomal RNA assembly protein
VKFVKVPLERVGALIGPEGRTKAAIERRLNVRLLIDSGEGDVTVEPHANADPLAEMKAESVVRALGRGFAPEAAFLLFQDEQYLTLIDLHDFVGRSKDHVRRITARLVGTGGKTRRLVEDLSEAKIVIYGHTVGIIGGFEESNVAREAVEMILTGSEHSTVYRFLEHKRTEQKMARWGI